VLPAGWRAAVPPGFDVDFRNADGTRGVAIMVYPSTPHREFGSLRRAEHIAAVAAGQDRSLTPTRFAGLPAWQLDAVASHGAALTGGCIVYPRCQAVFAAQFSNSATHPEPGYVGWLPQRPTRMIFTNTPLSSVVWIWATRPGDLPATVAEVQPMFDTLNLRFQPPGQ
jgi:hypothetical protein